MFDYFKSMLLFPQSFIFTLIMFGVLGAILTFIFIAHILAKHNKFLQNGSVFDGFLKNFFYIVNKFTLISYNSQSSILFEVFELLKGHFESKKYKYELPWTLIINTSDKNQSNAMLQSLNHNTQLGKLFSSDEKFTFTCFENGVTIEIDNFDTDTEEMIELFANHRHSIPLDSITILISLKHIINNTHDQNTILAKNWTNKIAKIYKITQTIIPIYIIFSELEELKGFDTFAKSITLDQQNEIFGWSSNYGLNQLPNNFQQIMFDEIINRVYYMQHSLLSSIQDKLITHDLIEFAEQFETLEKKLTEFLKDFNKLSLMKTMLIRGIYFTGILNNKVIFNDTLLNQKIFKERGLTAKTNKYLFYKNYWLRLLQFLVIISGFLSIYLLISNYYCIRENNYKTLPKWKNLESLVGRYSSGSVMQTAYTHDLKILISHLHLVDNNDLLYKTIPTTYLSNLWHDTEQSLINLTQLFFIDQITIKLQESINEFIKKSNKQQNPLKRSNYLSNIHIVKSKNYQIFKKFVTKLADLNKISNEMQDLHYQNNLNSLNQILKKLYNIELDRMFVDKNIFLQAIRKTIIKPISWNNYETKLKKLFNEKEKQLFDNVINEKHILSKLQEFEKQLNMLLNKKPDLFTLKHTLVEIINWIGSEAIDTFQGEKINIGNDWKEMLSNLENISTIIGKQQIINFYNKINNKFKLIKTLLLSAKLPIIGFLIAQDNTGKLYASPELSKLLGLLNTLVEQDLINNSNKKSQLINNQTNNSLCCKNKQTNNTQTAYLNLNKNTLAMIASKIDIFYKLHKTPNHNKGSIDIFKSALLILSEELELQLFLNTPNYDFNPDNIKGCIGYVIKIVKFAEQNNIKLYKKISKALINHLEIKTNKTYKNIHCTNTYSIQAALLKDNIDISHVQKLYDKYTENINTKIADIEPILDLYQTTHKHSNNTITSPILNELIYIWTQLKNAKNNSGDLILLQSSVSKVLSDPNLMNNADKEKWESKFGFFADKFKQSMIEIKTFSNKIELKKFNKDCNAIKNFFNAKLAGKFPFSSNTQAANSKSDDILEFYSELDNILKKYSIDFIQKHKNTNATANFIQNIINNRMWIEGLAKNITTDLMLKINLRANPNIARYENQIEQFILSCNQTKIDFRSKEQKIPFIPYENIKMEIDLSANSDFTFLNGNKHIKIKYEDQWALIKLIQTYKNHHNNNLIINIPIINKIKENFILRLAIKLTLLTNEKEIMLENIPTKAP